MDNTLPKHVSPFLPADEDRLFRTTNDYRLAMLGQCMHLTFKTERRKYALASLHLWLWPAIRLNQIVYTQEHGGIWTGYAIWAYFSTELANTFPKVDPPFLHISEWNEGHQLWILDFVAPFGNARPLARLLKERLGKTCQEACHVIRDNEGRVQGTRKIMRHAKPK